MTTKIVLVLPAPPRAYSAVDQAHMRDALMRAFLTLAASTAPATTAGALTFTATTTVSLTPRKLVAAGASGLVLADNTDATKPALGFVLGTFAAHSTATVYPPGSVITGLSGLTPGGLCYLSTSGALTQTVPSTFSQIVGTAIDATRVLFLPGTIGSVA